MRIRPTTSSILFASVIQYPSERRAPLLSAEALQVPVFAAGQCATAVEVLDRLVKDGSPQGALGLERLRTVADVFRYEPRSHYELAAMLNVFLRFFTKPGLFHTST